MHSSQKNETHPSKTQKELLLGSKQKPRHFLSDSSQKKPIFHAALIPESASVCDKGALNVLQR